MAKAKKPAKKKAATPVKKATAKKATAKTAVVKKAAGKNAAGKNAVGTKAAGKNAAAKKAAGKNAAVKKAVGKNAAATKVAGKNAAATKAAGKTAAAKRAGKKASAKSAAGTKGVAKTAAGTKGVAKTAAGTKGVAKTPAGTKGSAKASTKPSTNARATQPAARKPPSFTFGTLRRPLEALAEISDVEKEHLRVILMGTPAETAVHTPAWNPIELVEVIVANQPAYQLYLHPAGALMFDHGAPTIAASATKMGPTTPYVWVEPPKDPALEGVLAAASELVRGRPAYIDPPAGDAPRPRTSVATASTAPSPVGTPPVVLPSSEIVSAPATSHMTAAQAYANAVDATPVAQASAQAIAEAAAAVAPGTGLRLANYRLPLERIDRTTAAERAQIEALMAQEKMGPLEEADSNEEIHPFELVDVVDVASGEVRYQVYLWPFGSGAVFENASTNNVANICQHYWEQRPVDEDLRQKFAAAWNEAKALGIQQAVIWK